MSIAEDLKAALLPWDLTGDLSTYAEAIGQMFAQVELFAADTDTVVGWQPLWDVDLCPSYALPWLAQVVGERIHEGTEEAAAREQIRKTPNQYRGTPQAIAGAIKVVLTGFGKSAAKVWLRERFNGSTEDEDSLSILTNASETPDEQAVLNAIRQSVPADIDVFYQRLSGPTWATLEGGKTWTEIESTKGPTWNNIESSTGGYAGYTVYE